MKKLVIVVAALCAGCVRSEGLNAYGAVTWGQFFVYQGFNDRAGWMHTSSGVDNIPSGRTVAEAGNAEHAETAVAVEYLY